MKFKLNPIAAGVATALAMAQPSISHAQDDGDKSRRQLEIEEIVVTGTTSRGRTKLDSSVAITTVNSEQLALEDAFGTADVLELVPGFWVEDSGGEVSNNVAPRGLGGGAAFRFISIQEDGLPVIYDGQQVDSLQRQDVTIERFEAIRGGTAGVLTVNGPAAIVNFITRKGTETPEGTLKFTTADYGSYRGEFFYGGPLSDDWLIGLGGYYRSADSVRDVGFRADRGGQFRVNLTRLIDDGEINFSLKTIDESNSFYLPIPLANQNDPEAVPGVDPNEGTLLGPDVARFTHLTPGGPIQTNLRDGFATDAIVFGASVDKVLDSNWSVNAAARYTKFDLGVNAVFSRSLESASERLTDETPGLLAAFPTAVATQYRYTDTGDVISDPDALNGNGLLVNSIALFRERDIEQFVSDFRVNYSTDRNDVAFGVIFVDYSADDAQMASTYIGEAKDNPRRFDIVAVDAAGDVVGQLTDNSITQYGSWASDNLGNVTSTSFYVNDEFQVADKLRIDGGLRFEDVTFDVSSHVNEPGQSLGNENDNILANDTIQNFGSGAFETRTETFTETSWTIGASYTLTDSVAIYARYADSYQTPFLTNTGNLNEGISGLTFSEFGIRYIGETISGSITAYQTEFDNLGFTARDAQTGVENRIAIDTEATGFEFEGTWRVGDVFSLSLSGVIQDTEINGIPAGDVNEAFNGNSVQRTPEQNFRTTATYYVGDNVDIFASYHVLDDRFADIGNSVPLFGYETLAAGAVYRYGDDLRFQVKGNNLTDEIGLTEGNPRAGFTEATGRLNYLARPILGRTYTFSVTYDF